MQSDINMILRPLIVTSVIRAKGFLPNFHKLHQSPISYVLAFSVSDTYDTLTPDHLTLPNLRALLRSSEAWLHILHLCTLFTNLPQLNGRISFIHYGWYSFKEYLLTRHLYHLPSMFLSLAFSILIVPVLFIDSLEDSEFGTPNAQPARALRWYTSDDTPDAALARDCSSTMMPQRLGKVRARRGDSCEVREGGPILPNSEPPENIQREPIPWGIPAPFRIPVYDPIFDGKNPLCVTHTHGLLPLAVCDSGDINHRYDSDLDMSTSFVESSHHFPTSRLVYCTLGMCHLVRNHTHVSDSPTRSTTVVHQLLTPSVCPLVLQII